MSQHRGKEYVPRQGLWVENIRTQPGQFSTMDFFAVLHIGDAFISVTWENLLNANYFITPVYPMPGRNFKLGVNWVFVD
jgi:outer membrane cobalamin receptor